ncbi:DUF4062 domain-containing protein [Bordetella bronchiseptica]|uniref:DUF4062 domain-containing protein n=1 Tax=Bordetella bronchiseptica TaxID=518 RepID=UPI000461DE89|nr:DUF4062 domain-containing protein [Bordetella bronchiseptica]KDD27838.1 hypothetical protein L525_0545 [Bordetella bronchiseptica MBORD782]VTQ95035.1 Uncharacterised protein [Bordetella bronchiseptica]
MARPQIFISSTFYDLKVVRDDIARAMKELGYETIRHEMGAIPYARSDKLESSCYREIANCDILVCIIGGRYGSSSTVMPGSITQNELRSAYEQGKQVYVFVDKAVLAERTFFNKNKNVSDVIFSHDRKVFEFIDEVDQLPTGNPLFGFDNASDIIALLKEQLAGLFQRLLTEQSHKGQLQLLDELKSSISTVGELAKFLSAKADETGVAVKDILLTDHPLFAALRRVTKNGYRMFFADVSELSQWALNARRLKPVDEADWDSPNFMEWFKRAKNSKGGEDDCLLKVWSELFDEAGRLKPLSRADWKDSYVSYVETAHLSPDDDEIPF